MIEESYVLKTDRDEIKRVEEILKRINQSLCFPEDKFVNLLIAVSEALVNAIVHGNHLDTLKKVFLSISYNDNFITVQVQDEGSGFDTSQIPDPTLDENLLREHGRGLFIIKSLVDRCTINTTKSGTEVTLTIYKT
ncbi:MAG: ATP-binding protein [Ignavibacteria bacterium]